MDIGGDSSRLYFYDPVTFLKNMSLFAVSSDAQRSVEPNFFYLPFVGFLVILNKLLHSPYLLIGITNSMKLVLAFLSICWIIVEVTSTYIKKEKRYVAENSGILAGLFYIFTPSVVGNWARAILSTNQVFLNPLMFYLMLRFLLTHEWKYLWILLGTSFLFAPNFGLTGAPAFFAFYPLCTVFLLVYTVFIRKRSLPWIGIIMGFILFVGLHAFQILPQLQSLFDPGSFSNTRVFNPQSIIVEGMNYFSAVLPNAKVSWFILLPSYDKSFLGISLLAPSVICLAFILNRFKRRSVLLLAGLFFVITLFLVSANITHTWVAMYKKLFYIPGFSMFRNFSGQWQFAYSFYYALLLGISFSLVLERLAKKYVYITLFLIGGLFIVSAWPFISGKLVNPTPFDTDAKVHVVTQMDPKFEETLAFIRKLPGEGKILSLPFSDGFYQVLHGTNDGAYVGSSMISILTGKGDYVGYSSMPPFPEVFYRLVKERNYTALRRLFAILNIKYIFYNSDPRIYDETFPRAPFSYVRNYLPKTQRELAEFILPLVKHKVYQNSYYTLYEIESDVYLPEMYVPNSMSVYENNSDDWYGQNASFFIHSSENEPKRAFLDKQSCLVVFTKEKCDSINFRLSDSLPKIFYQRISPVKYSLTVSEANIPYVLVLSQEFNSGWKVFLVSKTKVKPTAVQSYFDGDTIVGQYKQEFFNAETFDTIKLKSLTDSNHFTVNGYANGWLINPVDVENKTEYTLILEMTGQRIFYIGVLISFITLLIYLTILFILLRRIVFLFFLKK